MIYRPAIKKDVEDIAVFLELCAPEVYELSTLNLKDTVDFLKGCLEKENYHIIICCDQAGVIMGVGGVARVPFIFNLEHCHFLEFIWHSLPGLNKIKRGRIMIELLVRMEEHAKDNGAHSISISTKPTNAIGAFIEREGYKLNENRYIKGVI